MPATTIFGAGPALGLSTARRFARAGHTVALVGRNAATLDPLAADLAADGGDVLTAVTDLADPAAALGALAEVESRVGLPDAIVYGPGGVERLPVGALALDADVLDTWLPLHLRTPLALAHATVPRMAERGSGAFVAVQGSAVRTVTPALASVAVAQSGLLSYLLALAAEVAPRGVHVASLQVGGLIEGSAAARLFDAGHFRDVGTSALRRIDPDDLAEQVWRITHGGDRVEYAA